MTATYEHLDIDVNMDLDVECAGEHETPAEFMMRVGFTLCGITRTVPLCMECLVYAKEQYDKDNTDLYHEPCGRACKSFYISHWAI